MKQLSDLLEEVKADAPPARYGVDDVIAAGRRRVRHRNLGWAAAAAVAVAIVIGVPRIASPWAGPPAPVPATPQTITPEFTFSAFAAGRLLVSEPVVWNLAGEQATISRKGTTGPVGLLTVYHRGVDPVAGGYRQRPTLTDVKPASGRRAFDVDPGAGGSAVGKMKIGWEYADGAIAVVADFDGAMTRAELAQVAGAFAAGQHRQIALAFKATSLPVGYQVASIDVEPSGRQRTGVYLISAEGVAARLARHDRGTPPGAGEKAVSVVLTAGTGLTVPERLTCADSENKSGRECTAPVPDCYATLTASSTTVPEADLRRILAAAEVADPGKADTWWPVRDAIPASALAKVK